MKKILILLLVILLGAFAWRYAEVGGDVSSAAANPAVPVWLETDSAAAIKSRLLSDFSLSFDDAVAMIRDDYPELSDSDIREFVRKHYIETKTIDGDLRVHRKSLRNLKLLNPDMNGGARYRGDQASAVRMAYADSIISYTAGRNPNGGAHRVTYRFIIDVPYDGTLAGDSLRVWMPLPFESARQKDICVHSSDPEEYVVSGLDRSVHNSIYFTKAAPVQPGDTAHFEYTASYTACGQYFSPGEIQAKMKPYDKTSPEYLRYTSFEAPHIVRLDSLARTIVGEETDPFRCSELVYDYIIRTFPWAGAREYSTISCIPEYVLREGHGDCGQVSLLYISLMRTLGIPARWESGWMLHPGEKNLHDWAEVYLNGVGWVPVDVSFGRYINSPEKAIVNFYSTGMDSWRFAANRGVCGDFFPPKKFVRSETVDFQLGEVECSRGNLFYPGWIQHLQIIKTEPVTY